jgi:hypothetical protein
MASSAFLGFFIGEWERGVQRGSALGAAAVTDN